MWHNSLAIPVYVALLSVVILVLHLLFTSAPVKKLATRLFSSGNVEGSTPSSPSPPEKSHIEQLGGSVIFGYLIARLLTSLALLGLSVATVILHHRVSHDWLQVGLCGVYVSLSVCLAAIGIGADRPGQTYTSFLAFGSVVSKPRLSKIASAHVASVLLITWAVYLYRDVWPLATFNLTPADAAEGLMLWAKLGVLSVAAAVVPLFMPREYVPVDPSVRGGIL